MHPKLQLPLQQAIGRGASKHLPVAFSLMEMLVTLSISVILLALALPSWQYISNRQQDQIVLQTLLQAIDRVRLEANVQAVPVALNQYHDYFLIYRDDQQNGRITDDEQIIAELPKANRRGKIYWRSFHEQRKYWVSNDNGHFWYCHDQAKTPAFAVVLNQTARARVVYPDKNGEIKDSQGKLLTCDNVTSTLLIDRYP